ncbi:MAG: ABC transporter ATP-binding protein [Alphaproteobacteria bacterium]|nr:ABC transporter ATP-binding protein [Alphaproteobacteria bacterium]
MSRIELSNVTKLFGTVQAVADFSMVVEKGEFITLLGPSGSGKTTTMRVIAGLERPDKGTVAIGDRIVSGPGAFVPTHRRSLGMVFQSYAVWPHKTVFKNVAFPLAQRGVDSAEQNRRVHAVLEKVELGQYAERYPSQLSGGQQQRVALARALVAEPEVILFDEPLSNLDAQLRESMRSLILDLHRELKITSVYVTHDQSEAMALSDRVYVMDHGRLMQQGTPDEIYEKPRSAFVAGFIGKANILPLAEVVDTEKRLVRLAGGEVLAAGAIEQTAEKILVVRPHQLRFASAAAEQNLIEGKVRTVTYLGDRVRYEVETASLRELIVELVAGGPRASEGEVVRVHFPVEHCRVI